MNSLLNKATDEALRAFTTEAHEHATREDRAVLHLLSRAWAELEQAQNKLDSEGEVLTLPNGYPGPNCWVKIRDNARKTVIALLVEMHLTPKSRSKLKAETEEKKPTPLEFSR